MTLINRVLNTINGDQQLDSMTQGDLECGLNHFMRDIETGQALQDNLLLLKSFNDSLEKVKKGRTVKVTHNNNTYRITKTNNGIKII